MLSFCLCDAHCALCFCVSVWNRAQLWYSFLVSCSLCICLLFTFHLKYLRGLLSSPSSPSSSLLFQSCPSSCNDDSRDYDVAVTAEHHRLLLLLLLILIYSIFIVSCLVSCSCPISCVMTVKFKRFCCLSVYSCTTSLTAWWHTFLSTTPTRSASSKPSVRSRGDRCQLVSVITASVIMSVGVCHYVCWWVSSLPVSLCLHCAITVCCYVMTVCCVITDCSWYHCCPVVSVIYCLLVSIINVRWSGWAAWWV